MLRGRGAAARGAPLPADSPPPVAGRRIFSCVAAPLPPAVVAPRRQGAQREPPVLLWGLVPGAPAANFPPLARGPRAHFPKGIPPFLGPKSEIFPLRGAESGCH